MSTEKKIIIDNVTKVYHIYNSPTDRLKEAFFPKKVFHTDFYALNNVSFDVDKGEIVGIMGRNGAGKSTLLKIITGVLQPTEGSVYVDGRISSLLELGAGFNVEYTGIENIYFYGTIMGLNKSEIDSKLEEIVKFAEIGDFVNQPVKSYSSGMFARLAFSCAINVEPDVLIVDEILSVGDMRFQSKCFKKFKEFKKKGVTILYVGHDISTMRSFCDRCIWMNKGQIVSSGDPAYISAQYTEFMYTDDGEAGYSSACTEDDTECSFDEKTVLTTVEEPSKGDEYDKRLMEGRPLAHWGSRIGIIRDFSFTVKGKPLTVCHPNDKVVLSFSIPYLPDMDYEYLSASFSIKNRDGLDLIVKTTYESGIRLSNEAHKEYQFRFEFEPRLTNGEYYLALAIENRLQSVISYYEYLEGAAYFKVYSDGNQFGAFLPDVDVEVH